MGESSLSSSVEIRKSWRKVSVWKGVNVVFILKFLSYVLDCFICFGFSIVLFHKFVPVVPDVAGLAVTILDVIVAGPLIEVVRVEGGITTGEGGNKTVEQSTFKGIDLFANLILFAELIEAGGTEVEVAAFHF